MNFYEVIPADTAYHGQEFLTYQHPNVLKVGQVVVVKLRTKNVLAFISSMVSKPSFATKSIDRIVDIVSVSDKSIELMQWLHAYYPATLGVTAGLFLPPSLNTKKLPQPNSDELSTKDKTNKLPALTTDQRDALKQLNTKKSSTYILHGNTGSGKTRVYIEQAKRTLDSGRSVLILTPEIALTPQLVKSFSEVFVNVSVTHSEQSNATRRNLWLNLSANDTPQVLIGPRSALFMPLQNIGLIILDEFHESAYKQEQAPHYHAVRVASKLRDLYDAQLILGSATPPITDYYLATSKGVPVVRMDSQAMTNDHPSTRRLIVDLSDDIEKSKYPMISKTMLIELSDCLARKQQALIFLNKRGSARLLVCQNCGWHSSCDRCDLPMVYHADGHRLQCHTCGQRRPAPSSCPTCGSAEILFKSPGTKTIVELLEKAFPDAVVARFDRDNKKAEKLESRHSDVADGTIDILVGTQLLAKGHDLPKLSLVGVLMADSELQFPDYSSEERSYQLIHQLVGRVGRGHVAGTAVIQTYNPEGLASLASDHSTKWLDFYQTQLEHRRAFGFPPFYFTLKIETARKQSKTAEKAIQTIFDHVRLHYARVELVGPSPSFSPKQADNFRWQLIVKAKDRTLLTDIARTLPVKATFDIDPMHLL